MEAGAFVRLLGADFFTGVPDSQLKALCHYLMRTYGTDPRHHVIAANEGNCAALAAGYHLATGRVPVVYMQNSGEGNIINPAASLLSREVYGIPVIFVIGWRGEPGVRDEPQHVFQGRITEKLLDVMEIRHAVVDGNTSCGELAGVMEGFRKDLSEGRDVAFVIRKGGLTDAEGMAYGNPYPLVREDVIRILTEYTREDPVVSTTGKASRELFEIREAAGEGHGKDFLTVGSMGHASSIALGLALQRPQQKVWCVDGDGAALMHMGAMAVIGAAAPANFIHVILDNEAHETVGGMPTVAGKISFTGIASACGYRDAADVEDEAGLRAALEAAREGAGPRLVCVRCGLGSRSDLGRPTTTAMENKIAFMRHLQS